MFHADGHTGTASTHGVSFLAIEPISQVKRDQLANGTWGGLEA